MKKVFFIAAVVAAMFIGCTKMEYNDIHDNNPNNTAIDSSKTNIVFALSSACLYTRHPWEPDGPCQNNLCYWEFCYLTLGCEGDVPMAVEVAIDTVSDKIKTVTILNYESLPEDYRLGFWHWLNLGYVVFEECSMVEDDAILLYGVQDNISDGVYPIAEANGRVTITFGN